MNKDALFKHVAAMGDKATHDEPIPNCPQEDKPLRERAWTDEQKLNAAVIALKVFRTWAACDALYPEHVIKVCDETLAAIGAKS